VERLLVLRGIRRRDIFAPIAGAIAAGDFPTHKLQKADPLGVLEPSAVLSEIIYIDHYGNAMTGLRAAACDPAGRLVVAGRTLRHANVFSEVAMGVAFWNENSLGLVEVAVNMGSAAEQLGLRVSQPIQLSRE
jgi:S-adenosylmethionine hydrolase